MIQATLMRSTIHLVSRADYWPFAIAVRDVRRASWLRVDEGASRREAAAETVRNALAGGNTMRRKEIEALVGKEAARVRRPLGRPRARAAVGHVGAPPRGPLRARRGLGRPAARHRARTPRSSTSSAATSAASGPRPPRTSPRSPVSPAPKSTRCSTRLDLDAQGDLLDVPGAPRPDPDTPAPPRFIGTWDASLLVHARRTGFLPEEHRPKIFHTKAPQSFPTFTVDGAVAGTWKYDKGRIELTPFGRLKAADRKALESEAERLAAFHSAA